MMSPPDSSSPGHGKRSSILPDISSWQSSGQVSHQAARFKSSGASCNDPLRQTLDNGGLPTRARQSGRVVFSFWKNLHPRRLLSPDHRVKFAARKVRQIASNVEAPDISPQGGIR
jgi:hypothetical protein